MRVRAKFMVNDVKTIVGGHGVVTLYPVTNGSKENDEFFKWTPSGKIELGTINAEAMAQFSPGKDFYVDFTEAVNEPVVPAVN